MQARIREIDMQIAGALERQHAEGDAQERDEAKKAASVLGVKEAGEILAGNKEALSTRVMDQFGIGGQSRENSVTIVVSKAGREVLVKNHVKNIGPLTDDSAAIENARILSRLGDEYLIEVEKRRVVIPKNLVLSWSKSS